MIPWLKWLLGHVKAWFQIFIGVSDSETLPLHMDDPPITASLGPLDRLISQLQSLEGYKHNLPVEFSANEIGLLIKHLKQFCNTMKNLSQMEDTSFIDKWWMKEVRDLCYDTEDYLDEVMVQYGAGVPRTWTRLLLEDVKIPPPIGRIAGVIIFWIHSKLRWCPQLSHFRARAEVLSGRCPSSIDEDKVDDTCLNKEITADISIRKEDRADIENLTAQLVEMLAFDDKQTQLKVVPIYGLAGAGKTILARTLYAKYKRRFQCWAFVRVSRNPDIRSILTSILSQIKAPPASPPMSQVQDLIHSISTHLKTKRYFVVIDNIQRTSVWDIISRALPGDNCGSRIIITTESEHVASACSGYYLGSTIFQMDAVNACTDTITSKEKNKDINLRYNNLPPHLKTCLLFLCMHPDGCTIMKNNLVKQWVAEGFIPALKRQDTEEISQHNRVDFSETLQDQAEEIAPVNQDQREEIAPVNQDQREEIAGGYFDELVTRGMIQPVDRDHKGEVLSCTVHHMVLDLIRYKSKDDNFLVVVDNLESTLGHPDIVRRLSVQFGCEKGASIPESIILSQVRSLIFYGFLECVPSIPDYRLLRVLHLNIWADEDKIFDLTRIGELYHLRYLKIECNVTVRLPSKIRRLQHLGTLELHAEVVAIPSDIGHLEKLMHVCCPSKADMRDLGDLTHLLELQLTCSTVENLEERMKSLRSILEKLSRLRCLALVPASGSCSVNTLAASPSRMCISCDSLFNVSRASANLRRLELSRHCGIFSRLPKWIGKLGKLCSLKIAVGNLLMEDIDILKGMPSLTVLSLHVQTMYAKRIVFGKEGFLVLTYFKFTCSVPWLIEAGAMPNLEKLKLCFNSPIVDEQGNTQIITIGRLLGLKEISAIIGSAGAESESVRREAIKNDSRNPRVQLMGSIYYGDHGREMDTHESSGEDENNEADIRYPESTDSFPRSHGRDSWDEPRNAVAAGYGGGRLRLMCSFGGRIVPRPTDKSLCYLGGETRIVAVDRNATLGDVHARLSRSLLAGQPFTLKYQLPNEDLDSLISVSTDEDLNNLVNEYDRVAAMSSRMSRIRLFLFPAKPESSSCRGSLLDNSSKSENWFVDALNNAISGSFDAIPLGISTDSASVNCVLSLEDDSWQHSLTGVPSSGPAEDQRAMNQQKLDAAGTFIPIQSYYHQPASQQQQAPAYYQNTGMYYIPMPRPNAPQQLSIPPGAGAPMPPPTLAESALKPTVMIPQQPIPKQYMKPELQQPPTSLPPQYPPMGRSHDAGQADMSQNRRS